MSSVSETKQVLRKRMRALRLVVDQKDGPLAAQEVTKHFLMALDSVNVGQGTIVGQ